MKSTPLISILISLLQIFSVGSLLAQPYDRWSKPEQALAKLLIRDTISQTVAYLPGGYWFGLEDRTDGSLVLVKDGVKNYILRDGTHQVYLLESQKGIPSLHRIDSSVFAGDNFLMMAFLRNDTLYQYGGYGFWNTRDFFMRYRAANRDWDFLTGGNGLPNELNYHYYDKTTDAFYVMGSISSSHHPFARKILADSVFRYDFSTRRWTALGKIRDDFDDLGSRRNDNLSFCFTPFGLLDCRTFAVKLYDIPNNRILTPKEHLIDKLLGIGRDQRLFEERYRQFILLQDTLHILQGRFDTVRDHRIHVALTDFNEQLPQRIYSPASSHGNGLPGGKVGLLLATILPLAGLAFSLVYRKSKKKENADLEKKQKTPDLTDETEMISPENQSKLSWQPIVYPSDPLENDANFFLTQLNPTEAALLDMLLKETRSGNTADIHAINKTLGVSNKDASLQKARRSIAINHINSCFRQSFKEDGNLIIRERDKIDKRAFVYRLDPRFLDRLKG